MALRKKFRISTRYKEIFGVIAKAKQGDQNFIWKMVKEKRLIMPIEIVEVQGAENRIETRLKEYTGEVKAGDIIYLKLDSRDSAFKTEVLERVGPKVILMFPDEMVMNENRATERHYFHASDDKFIQLKKVKNLVSSLSEKSYNVNVCDISDTGIALFLPLHQEKDFQLKEKIKLEMLGLYRLETDVIGEVVFKMQFEIKGALGKEPGFKVGIQLDSKIPKSLLERFLLKKNMFSITEEQIVRDEAFRKKVHLSMKRLQKSLCTKKQFKEFFASLEVQRSENQYLKQHILLLCEVMSGLGEKLGWVSSKTIDKLIYVAFLHDIRFMQFPKLARIQTKKEFEILKPRLTMAEQKAFLEAPKYAAEMARQDSEAYPDAIKMLLQQKELPDGSGHPQGLTSNLLAPLSCLFIFSHFFVDYVIDNPDWTISDFQRTFKPRLKGQYFQKLFQIIDE